MVGPARRTKISNRRKTRRIVSALVENSVLTSESTRAPLAHNSDQKDVRRADFTWCMTAIDWGWSVEDTAERLLEESDKTRENGPAYALLTARKAAAAVERRTRS